MVNVLYRMLIISVNVLLKSLCDVVCLICYRKLIRHVTVALVSLSPQNKYL